MPKTGGQTPALDSKPQKQPPEMFYEKSVCKNCPKFPGKHLVGISFSIKLQSWDPQLYYDRNFDREVFQMFYKTPPGDWF